MSKGTYAHPAYQATMASASLSFSQLAAKERIERLCKERGYIPEHVLAKMDLETRQTVEEALLRKDELIGSTIITYVQTLSVC